MMKLNVPEREKKKKNEPKQENHATSKHWFHGETKKKKKIVTSKPNANIQLSNFVFFL